MCDKSKPEEIPLIIFEGRQSLMPGMKFVIIGHSMIAKFANEIKAYGFKLLVVDESQHFANMTSKRTKALLDVAKDIPHRITTSGTAILNRASEYWPTLNLVKPDHWPYFAHFIRNWVEAEATGTGAIKLKGIKTWKREQFFEKTRPYVLRRLKRDVLKDLPPFSRHFKVIDISQSAIVNSYNKEAKNLDDYMHSKEYYSDSGFARTQTLLGYLMRMRHLCGVAKAAFCVEDTVDFLESTANAEGETGEEPKLIVGCLHDDVFENLAYGLKQYAPVLLPAGLDAITRQRRIDEFKTPSRRLAIAKILAQGEGLNLQFCSNMIVLERMWNPGKEEQFEARIDRYGQKNKTVADYIVAKNTVDEDFSEFVESKRVIVGETLNEQFDVEQDPALISMMAERAARRRL